MEGREFRPRLLACGASVLALAFATGAQAQAEGQQAPTQPPVQTEQQAQATMPSGPGGVPAGTRGSDGAQQTNVPVADAPEKGGTTVSEVVVTGFRAAIASAIQVKRNESGVVDVIKAEDIAKFPDNNLAEALQRIPGVAITRAGGEGRNITVRGLGPGSTRVRINGIEALATTGASDADGGANRNRQFDFNVFASELFNTVEVRKTASASVEEGSLGATVDLTTARPFDFKSEHTAVVSLQGGYNDLSKQFDPRIAALFSHKFFNDTFGALVSVAYSRRHVREEGFDTVRWDSGPSNGGFCSPAGYDTNPNSPGIQTNPATNATVGTNAANCFAGDPRLPGTPENIATYQTASDPGSWHPRIPRYARLDYDESRLGITGSLQWKPTPKTLVNFDYLYSEYVQHRSENQLEGISFSRGAASPEFGKPYMIPRVFQTDPNGSLVYGVFDNVDVRIESRYDEIDTLFTQYNLSASHEFSDNFKVSGMYGSSRSNFKNPIQTTITFDRANQDGWTYDARQNANLPNINWGFDINDPNSYTFTNANSNGTIRPSEIRLRPQFVLNTFDEGIGDLQYTFNPTFTLRAGGEWKKYENAGKELRRSSEFNIPALPTGTTMSDISSHLTGFGSGLDGPNIPTAWVQPNFGVIAKDLDIYCNCGVFALQGVQNSNARGSWRTIIEESEAGYLQLDFDTSILPWRLRGDIGVRYVNTDITASGYQFAGGAPVQVTIKNSYDNWLPALNLVAEVTPDFLARFGAAQVMVRPGLGSLNPGGTLNTTGNLTITAGNPYLKPQEANTYDLSFEWYPTRDSLVALGFFYKDIKTGFTTVRLSGPYSSFGLPDSLLAGTGHSPSDQAFYSTTINTTGGQPLKGLELNIQEPFRFLPRRFGLPNWTGNFGALFNYTYVTGSQQFCAQTVSGNCVRFISNRPTGVSEHSANATLFYEDNKLSARVSAAFRSAYLIAVPSQNAGNLTSSNRQDYSDADWVPDVLTIDASISYSISEKLKLTLEGLNLNDEPNLQYNDTIAQRVYTDHHYGRQFYFGVRYAF